MDTIGLGISPFFGVRLMDPMEVCRIDAGERVPPVELAIARAYIAVGVAIAESSANAQLAITARAAWAMHASDLRHRAHVCDARARRAQREGLWVTAAGLRQRALTYSNRAHGIERAYCA